MNFTYFMKRKLLIAALAAITLMAVLVGPVQSQSLQVVEVRVEVAGSLKDLIGAGQIAKITDQAVKELAPRLGQIGSLKTWKFGGYSPYDIVFSIKEGEAPFHYDLYIQLELEDSEPVPPVLPPIAWCKPGSAKLGGVGCDYAKLRVNPNHKEAANQFIVRRISALLAEDRNLAAKLATSLADSVPITRVSRWYDKDYYKPIDRKYQPTFTAATPLDWPSYIYLERTGKHPYVWCVGEVGEESLEVTGEWIPDPLEPVALTRVEQTPRFLGIYVRDWRRRKIDPPEKITKPICRDGYRERQVRLQSYWWYAKGNP